jgi:hypothetical protein
MLVAAELKLRVRDKGLIEYMRCPCEIVCFLLHNYCARHPDEISCFFGPYEICV